MYNLEKYYDFLKMISDTGAAFYRMNDYINIEPKANEKIVAIRHDVDHNIDLAIEMAMLEAKEGISSTYFLLHTAGYWNTPEFTSKARLIQEMGHEVGFHNDIISYFSLCYNYIHESLLVKGLLEKFDNIDIYGSAAHGSALARYYNYRNYEIFKECSSKTKIVKCTGLQEIEYEQISMKDYFNYEAYFVEKDFFYSDAADDWNDIKKEEVQIRSTSILNFDLGTKGIILIHPCHWRT